MPTVTPYRIGLGLPTTKKKPRPGRGVCAVAAEKSCLPRSSSLPFSLAVPAYLSLHASRVPRLKNQDLGSPHCLTAARPENPYIDLEGSTDDDDR